MNFGRSTLTTTTPPETGATEETSVTVEVEEP